MLLAPGPSRCYLELQVEPCVLQGALEVAAQVVDALRGELEHEAELWEVADGQTGIDCFAQLVGQGEGCQPMPLVASVFGEYWREVGIDVPKTLELGVHIRIDADMLRGASSQLRTRPRDHSRVRTEWRSTAPKLDAHAHAHTRAHACMY